MGVRKLIVIAGLLPLTSTFRNIQSEVAIEKAAAEALPEEDILKFRRDAAESLRAMYPLDDYWMETCTATAFDPMAIVRMMKSFVFSEMHDAFPELAERKDLIAEFNGCFAYEQIRIKSYADVFKPTTKVCKALRTCTFKIFNSLTLEKASPAVSQGMNDFVKGIEFPELPEELKQVLFDLLLNYFDKASVTLKLPMAISYLQDLPPPMSGNMKDPQFRKHASKAMGNALQGAGPFTHKMLQSTGDKVSLELQEILAAFKDAISPMSQRELMHQVTAAGLSPRRTDELAGKFMLTIPDKGTGPSGNYLAPEKATSSASIGQGHLMRGTIMATGAEKIWLKVMRPFLEEKLTEEYAILDSVIPEGSNVAKAMLEVKASVRNELDWEQEGRFMRRGYELYHGKEKGIRSVALHQILPEDQPVVLIMEALTGTTLSAWISKPTANPREACEAARMYGGAFRIWSREALAASGFFHGDPHAGNFMMDFSNGALNGALTFIDYGNSFEINDPIKTLSLPFVQFLMGALFDSPGMVVQAFEWHDEEMKAAAVEDIQLAWKELYLLRGSIGKFTQVKGFLATWIDAISSIVLAVVQKVPVALVGSALSGFSKWVHSRVALESDSLADELQERVLKAFNVLFTYQHSMDFPPGLFGFSRALDLFTSSFKQMRDKKGEQLREQGCEFHLQHPLIQIVNAFSQHGATTLVSQSFSETLAGSKKLFGDIIQQAWK